MTALLLLVPFLPLAAAGAIAIAGRRMPRRGGGVAAGAMAGSAVLLVALGPGARAVGGPWLTVGGLTVTAGLEITGLTWWAALLVAIVSTLVTAYAVAYMAHEEGRARFFAWMAFFAGSMLALVLADSLLLLFAAWEGVGLASFALIGHRHRQARARQAARKAFLVTRAGDAGLLLGWLLLLGTVGTTDIGTVTRAAGTAAGPTWTLAALLLLLGAVGKSAQLPLTAWLPDAMAGPTPVSALIHSATMVAAGVFLILRLHPVFAAVPASLAVLRWVGGGTALVAAVVATGQGDLKRVLAWSTVSQLGEMMLALGLAAPVAAALHLTVHAAFKAALFLAAGVVEHATGTRELGELGALWRRLPWTAAAFGLAALALAGVPPLSGFWSEEGILKAAAAHHPGWGVLMVTLVLLAGLYIGRAGAAVFLPWRSAATSPTEPPDRLMLGALWVLAASAALGGLAKAGTGVLPFPPETAHVSPVWSVVTVMAGLAGLALGTWRVMVGGAGPALGVWVGAVERGIQAATGAPARAAEALGRATGFVESALDTGARALAAAALILAQALASATERLLDTAGRGAAGGTLGLGAAGRRTESGLDAATRSGASGLGRAGHRLSELEVGRIYVYTASLFVALLVVGAAGVAFWIARSP